MCVYLNAYMYPDGEPTTTPPEVNRPELWIAVSLLLLFMTAIVCGVVLFLRFRHAHCKPKNTDERNVTLLKVPNGDDPTYGVRDI